LPLISFGKRSDAGSGTQLIKWNDSFSVGITDLDWQHQMLISMLNELQTAMLQVKTRNDIEKVLDGFISYIKTHFETEEKYFDKFAYPWSAGHKLEHQSFTKTISIFKDDFKQNKSNLTGGILTSFNDWLKNHINESDKKYSYFLSMKGLK
jgi:hemerythrin